MLILSYLSQPRWETYDFNVPSKSCSGQKMTIKLFVKHQKVIAIHNTITKATIMMVQNVDQNEARTHRLGAIVI